MIQSMTGFATKTIIIDIDAESKINLTVSIKALNSRFFEASCKLPYILNHLEHDFIKLLKKKLSRGHIYLVVHMSNQNMLKGTIEPAKPVIQGYLDAIKSIKKQFNIKGELTIDELLRIPAVFNVTEKGLKQESIQKIVSVVNELITEVTNARKKEGNVLQDDLKQRINIMQTEINSIESATEELMKRRKSQVSEEVNSLDLQEKEGSDIRRQIIYATLDKIDIHEEIIRFKSHLSNILSLLTAPGIEKGKRIDFTLQELGREINTIAAKCSDVSISSMAINIKVELEKAREQTQNIL